jgi:hypothetical protein
MPEPAPTAPETQPTPAPAAKPAGDMSFGEYLRAQPARDDAATDESEDGQPQPKPVAQAEAPPAKGATASPASDDQADQAAEGDEQAPTGSPRALLLKGDIEGAFKAAFGKSPADFQINSKQWVAMRHERQKARSAVEAKQTELRGIATELQREYAPFAEARELWQKGDVEGAVKAAFGVPWNEAAKRALKQYHERDPRIEAQAAELAALKREIAEREERDRERAEQHRAETERQTYLSQVSSTLEQHSDPTISKAAKRPAFVQAVFAKLQEHWDGYETIPVEEAANLAKEQFFSEWSEWRGVFDGGPSDRGASTHAAAPTGAAIPARQETHAVSKTLKQSEAAEVSAIEQLPDGPERDAALKRKYMNLFRHATIE